MAHVFAARFFTEIGFATKLNYDEYVKQNPEVGQELEKIMNEGFQEMKKKCVAVLTPRMVEIKKAEQERKMVLKETRLKLEREQLFVQVEKEQKDKQELKLALENEISERLDPRNVPVLKSTPFRPGGKVRLSFAPSTVIISDSEDYEDVDLDSTEVINLKSEIYELKCKLGKLMKENQELKNRLDQVQDRLDNAEAANLGWEEIYQEALEKLKDLSVENKSLKLDSACWAQVKLLTQGEKRARY